MEGTGELPPGADIPANPEYVDNGVLFFIFNKINFMPHDNIIDICKDFYTEADIEEAKDIMYTKFNCPEQAKKHRGANKALHDLKEMVLFMSQQPAPNCIFCISKCTQAPPVVMDFIDAAALSRHITTLRGEVTVSSSTLRNLELKVKQMEEDLDSIRRPMETQLQQRETWKELPQQQLRQENQHPQTHKRKTYRRKSLPTLLNPTPGRNQTNAAPARETSNQPEGRPTDDDVAINHQAIDDTSAGASDSDDVWEHQRHQRRKLQRQATQRNQTQPPNNRRQARRPAVIGTRSSAGLTAARPLRDITIFVSRLAPEVESEVLQKHVESIVGVEGTTTCELQPQRHPSYVSYKVTVKGMLKENIEHIYRPENWDRDILVKRWFY